MSEELNDWLDEKSAGGDWIPHHGGPCPVDKHQHVRILRRGHPVDHQESNDGPASSYRWPHVDVGSDITHYRVLAK